MRFPRNAHIWLWPLIKQRIRNRSLNLKARELWVLVADHFEPFRNTTDENIASERQSKWEQRYPEVASELLDDFGTPLQHTFFFPLEDYNPYFLDRLAQLQRRGFGHIEIHWHLDGETRESFIEKLGRYAQVLGSQHGLLHSRSGLREFAFIHGNWALCNSRRDGRWCGVNDQLTALKEAGCYMDLTMPAAPSECQSRVVNEMYFATSQDDEPRWHDRGFSLIDSSRLGSKTDRLQDGPHHDMLIMLPGPLMLDFKKFKYGVLPRLENAELTVTSPVSPERVENWVKAGIFLPDCSTQVIKLHCHGCTDHDSNYLLNRGFRELHLNLQAYCRNKGIRLKYVNPWDVFCHVMTEKASVT